MFTQAHQQYFESLLGKRALADAHERAAYAADWSADNPCDPVIVLRPRDVDEVAVILAYCNREQLAVVVQGGRTGLSGGATPQHGEVALSLELLNGIVELDAQSMTLTAGAGTPLETIQQAAADAGLRLPLDLGARGSCTIGGNVSTNAGGNQVLQFGMTRALVLGLTVVLADGTIVRNDNKMLKNNAGYDLKQLFIGSEGTLGVVTEVVLRLFPQAGAVHSAWCCFERFDQVIRFLRNSQAQLGSVSAFEVMWADYLEQVLLMNPGLRLPVDDERPLYVLIEHEGNSGDAASQFTEFLAGQMAEGDLLNAVIASSQQQAAQFWALRDGIAEILTQVPARANFDIGVPVSKMEAFVDQAQQVLRAEFPSIVLCTFGHIADGNLHIICWTGEAHDVAPIYQRIYRLIGDYSGTITAEHGVGASKRDDLPSCRSPAEIALMRSLKKTLDPNNILNPRRVIPD